VACLYWRESRLQAGSHDGGLEAREIRRQRQDEDASARESVKTE